MATFDGSLTKTPNGVTFPSASPIAEVPLSVSYQPRWWMQVDLALADDVDSPLMGALAR